ncbi:MAG: sugar ABC transporter ATP-binding protein [Oscillospiraceae bacterium]|nr:sugar ABC transporter ATP-binding protein [Oscillospiraceae bacterium]
MLELKHISKYFPGVKALQDISVDFREGEIHAILGENGAGKSTLMKIICGIYQADEGEVVMDGRTLRVRGYKDAVNHHISIVNQEITLIPDSSIAENIVLDKMHRFTRGGFVNWGAVYETASKYLRQVRLDLDPKMPVRHLSAANKQLIQIAKALSTEAKVLLLDEPTSSLTQYEAQILFDLVRDLKKQGVIMIFVSHKLEEVQMISDRVTVFRDGCLVGTDTIDNMPRDRIVQMMIGRSSSYIYRGRLDAENNEVALEARNICSKKHGFRDLSFQVRRGELLGFYGLVGSGRTELVRTVLGVDKMSSGEVLVYGKPARTDSLATSLRKYRIGYVSENRKEEGLFLDNSITMNICMNSLQKDYVSAKMPFISPKKEAENAQRFREKLEIKTPTLRTKVGSLSGGNQQKVSIAKWLSSDCDIIIIDEPTVGVDIGAKEYIHRLIWDLAKKENKAVILISSDMNEIISLARRILIFKDREIVDELKGEDFFARPGEEISAEIGKSFI